ncbi:MAG TPA: Flp pilus assembly protein CpaB [Candidatus Dormibacteraeota bacterium]|nr:Flp pilus assembly protein CpaB [Candidatus Dormibacteraeota bacterium]
MRTFSAITSRRPFTLLGFLLAIVVIVAFVLVALNASQSGSSPTQLVVMANKDLQPRIPITKDDLTTKSIPVPADYPKVYFESPNDIVGFVPLVPIVQGEIISSNDVARPNQALGSQSEYLPIPPGYVALTIPTSEQQGVADQIQPGDYITMIATVSGAGKVSTKTIYWDIRVIKVGTPSSTPGSSATSLTIVVSQCQAEIITWFLTYASLKYSLESYKDYLANGLPAPDPNCETIKKAKGVTLQIIQQSFPTLF